LPKDYEVQMFKKRQGLSQKEMDVKSYTEEFYTLSIRSGQNETEVQKVARYISGLRFNMQDELVLTNPRSVEDYYQMVVRVEEKLKRRQDKSARGKGNTSRGRGSFNTKQVNESQEDMNKTPYCQYNQNPLSLYIPCPCSCNLF